MKTALQTGFDGAPVIERPAGQRERFYFPELDSLRFFAFLIVFIHHLPLLMFPYAFWRPGVWRSVMFAGAYGVDLFFALSAFLLTQLFLREREAKGTIEIGYFYIRRILRIWPLYFFFIALIAGLGHFSRLFMLPGVYLLMLVLLVGNFLQTFHDYSLDEGPV